MVENVTPKNLIDLAIAGQTDINNPSIIQKITDAVNDRLEAERVREIASEGGLEDVISFEEAYKKAVEKIRNAQEALERVQRERQAAAENMQNAYAEYANDPSSQMKIGAVTQAIHSFVGASKVVMEYQQSLRNAESGMQDAKSALDRVRDASMRKVREQAKADVQTAKAQEAKRKAEQLTFDAMIDTMNTQEGTPYGLRDNAGQLSSSLGRADGRTDYGVSAQRPGLQRGLGIQQAAVGDDTEGKMVSKRSDDNANGQTAGNVVTIYALNEKAKQNLDSKGVSDFELAQADPERFSIALDAGRASNAHGLYVDPQSVEELTKKGAITILSSDGLAGVAIGTVGKDKGAALFEREKRDQPFTNGAKSGFPSLAYWSQREYIRYAQRHQVCFHHGAILITASPSPIRIAA